VTQTSTCAGHDRANRFGDVDDHGVLPWLHGGTWTVTG
jgi:hypothetical protein